MKKTKNALGGFGFDYFISCWCYISPCAFSD